MCGMGSVWLIVTNLVVVVKNVSTLNTWQLTVDSGNIQLIRMNLQTGI